MSKGWDTLPGLHKPALWSRKWFIELVAIGPPVLAAAVGAWQLFEKDLLLMAAVSILGIVWLVGANVLRVRQSYISEREERGRRGHEGVYAALVVCRMQLCRTVDVADLDPGHAFRMTVLRVVPPLENPMELEQLVPYAGGHTDGAGRRFPIAPGITGRAARCGHAVRGSVVGLTHDERIKALVSEWGYTTGQAKRLTEDRTAWMAIPFHNDRKQVAGVLYADTSKGDIFSDAVLSEALDLCDSLRVYMSERYRQ